MNLNARFNSTGGNGMCPFLNDSRLFGLSANAGIWYKDDHFCSVADTVHSSYETVDGIIRRVSATNQFVSCCEDSGENCPVFQKFNMMGEDELAAFYRKKWKRGVTQWRKRNAKTRVMRSGSLVVHWNEAKRSFV